MTYWIGDEAAIRAANKTAFAAYEAENPTADRGGQTVPNATARWDTPRQTSAGTWAILAYPGMSPPEGCRPVQAVDWPGDPVA